MEALDAPEATPASALRRSAAVGCNAVLLALVAVLALRFVADVAQEAIPASIAPADACTVLEWERPTAWCTVRGDHVYYSPHAHPLLRVVSVVIAMSFANSVVAPWITATNLGKGLLGLRVLERATGGPLRFSAHLRRWAGWPISSFGAIVVSRHPSPPGAARRLAFTGGS